MDHMHEGHRKRMLRRLEADERSLQDHELVEILLFNVKPRINTNETAHRLLAAFGSLDGIYHASYKQLLSVEGVGPETAAYLRINAILNERMRFNDVNYPAKFNFESYTEFIGKRFHGLTEEIVEVYALDSSERVKCSARFTSHNIDKAYVDMDDFTLFLSTNRPHGIVVAHNHPQNRAKASEDDDSFTAAIAIACSQRGVVLYDHIIAGSDGFYSYFREGRIQTFREIYSIKNLLKSNQK